MQRVGGRGRLRVLRQLEGVTGPPRLAAVFELHLERAVVVRLQHSADLARLLCASLLPFTEYGALLHRFARHDLGAHADAVPWLEKRRLAGKPTIARSVRLQRAHGCFEQGAHVRSVLDNLRALHVVGACIVEQQAHVALKVRARLVTVVLLQPAADGLQIDGLRDELLGGIPRLQFNTTRK